MQKKNLMDGSLETAFLNWVLKDTETQSLATMS
jgi:hypothetical protein